MNKNKTKIISTSIGLILIVLLIVVLFPNSMSRFSNNKVLTGTIKIQNNSISNYLKNTNDLVTDNTKDSNFRYKSSDNNYIKIDNHLYQIIGIFDNNIKVIDTKPINIELDDYYNELSNNVKRIIIESIYYNGETNSNEFLQAYEEEKSNSIKKKVYFINTSDYLFSNWLSIDEIKPVFYIDGNINYIEGTGTKDNPYKV